MITSLRDHPKPVSSTAGRVPDYVTPEAYRGHYVGATWMAPSVMLAGNLGYAAAYFLLGCAAFSRRDLSLD